MVGTTETIYVWDWVESGANYYYFGGRKVAMRNGTVTYLYADHLTSTVETNDSGANPSQLYYPYGAERRSGSLPTPYRYTGQRWESAIGLYFYNARWYDPALGRFIQPDTIVPEPGNPQALNRYSYAGNNPTTYNDPSGHERVVGTGQGLDERYWEIQERLQSLDLRNDLERDIASFLLWEGSYPIPEPTGAFSYAGFGMSLQIVLEQLAGVEPTSDWQKFWHDPDLYAGIAVGITVAARGSGKSDLPPVAIGENMKRVGPLAAQYGAETFQQGHSVTDLDQIMGENRAWIRQQISEGRRILDFGPDYARRSLTGYESPFYQMEIDEINNQGYWWNVEKMN